MPPLMGNELLRGELVFFGRPTKDEIDIIANWSNDMEYSRMLRRGLVYPNTSEDYQEWWGDLAKHDHGYPFAVHRIDDGSVIGFLAYTDMFWQARHCSIVIGIDPALRGRGYGTDTLRVTLKYAFMEMNLNRVGLDVMSYNAAAIRAYTKVGFQREGTKRAVVFRDGVYYDIHCMSILRAEWEALYHQPPVSYPDSTTGAASE